MDINNIANARANYVKNLLLTTLREKTIFLETLTQEVQVLKTSYPNLDKVFLAGWTPEWNDGEECVHSSDIYIDNTGAHTGAYTDIKEGLERLNNWDYEMTDEEKSLNSKLTASEIKKLRSTFFDINTYIESVYGTNYKFVFDFTNEVVTVEQEAYESHY